MNQPPDMDIIMFHTRPGVAKGSSRRQKRCQGERRKPRRGLVEVGGDGAQLTGTC